MASDDSEFSRRWRKFIITPQTFFAILQGEARLNHVLPKDSKAVGITYDPSQNAIQVYLESEEFDTIPFGNDIPVHMLKVKRLDVRRN